MNKETYELVLKYTRLGVMVVLVMLIMVSFYFQRIDLETLLRAVMAVMALNNGIAAFASHQTEK